MSHNQNGNYVLFSTGSRAPTRNWSRLQNNRFCLTSGFTSEQLAERRKYETLQHNQNKGSSTKAQQAAAMARRGGISTTAGTTLNSNGSVYTLNNCDATSGAGIYHPPSASGLRGTWNIVVDANFLERPLVDYSNRKPTLSSGGLGMSDEAPNSVACMSSAPTVTTPATTGLNRRIKLNWNDDIAGCYDILGFDIAIQSNKSLHLGGDLIYSVKQEWIRDLNAYDTSYVLGEVNIMKNDISYGFFKPTEKTLWYKGIVFSGSINDKQGDTISIGQDGSYSLYVLSTTNKFDSSFVDNFNINNNTNYRRRIDFARSHDFGNSWEISSNVILPGTFIEINNLDEISIDISNVDIGEYHDIVVRKGNNAGKVDLSNNKIFVNYSTNTTLTTNNYDTRLSNSNNDGGFVITNGVYSTAVNDNYNWSDLSLGFEHPNTTGFGKYISNDMSDNMIYTVFSSVSGDTTIPFDSSLIIAFGDTNNSANNPIYKDGSNCVIDASALLSPINSFAVQNPTGLDGCGNFYVAYRREVNGINDVSLAFAKTTNLSENTIWDISGIDNIDISGGLGNNAKNQNVSCFAGYGEHYSNYVYVAYYDSGEKALKFARSDNCGNDWETQYIDGYASNNQVTNNYNNSTGYNSGTKSNDVGQHCSLVGETCIRTIDAIQNLFDVSMYLFISYYNESSTSLKCAFNPVNGEAGKWIISTIDTPNVGTNSKICILRDKRGVPYPNIVYRETDGNAFNVKYARPTQYLDIPLINDNQYECTVTPLDILGRNPCKITRPVGSVIGEPIGNAGPCTDFSGQSFNNAKVALSWVLPSEFNTGDQNLLDPSGIKISVSATENDFTNTNLVDRKDLNGTSISYNNNPIYLPGDNTSYDVSGLINGEKYFFRIETANRPTTNPINTSDIIFSPESGTTTSAAQNLLGNSVIDTSGQPLTVPTVSNLNAILSAGSVKISWTLDNDGRDDIYLSNNGLTINDNNIIFDLSSTEGYDISSTIQLHSSSSSYFTISILNENNTGYVSFIANNKINYEYLWDGTGITSGNVNTFTDNKWYKFIISARNESLYNAGNGPGRGVDISHNNNNEAEVLIETIPQKPTNNDITTVELRWGGSGQYGEINGSYGLNNLPFDKYVVERTSIASENWNTFTLDNDISYGYGVTNSDNINYEGPKGLGGVYISFNPNTTPSHTTNLKYRVKAIGTSLATGSQLESPWSNDIMIL